MSQSLEKIKALDSNYRVRKKGKTKEQSICELSQMHQRVTELERLGSRHRSIEEDLKEKFLFLENILQSSTSISIISTDREHNIVYWNTGAENIFGYKAHEVVLREKIELIYPEDDKDTKMTIENARGIILNHKQGVSCLVKEVAKNGSILWINLTLTPRIDSNGEVIGILGIGEDITERKQAEDELRKCRECLEELVEERTAKLVKANEQLQREIISRKRVERDNKRAEKRLEHTLGKLREALGGVIQAMALTVERRDPYTAGHQRRVADLARSIAAEMDLSVGQIDGIRFSGVIHDLGKISIPAEILSKPTRLTDIEFDLIKTHPQIGYDILKTIEFPWPIAQIVYQHHERIDGSGYPLGLAGKDILMEARILGVADVVEAMASHRPYRPALGLDKALQEISRKRGILYDPAVVDVCLRIFTEKKYSFDNLAKSSHSSS